MMNKKIGRNDPCPCGSGKKYKRCCLAEDERRATPRGESAPAPDLASAPDTAAPPPAPSPDIRHVASLMRQLARKSPRKDRAEFERVLAMTQPILDYMEREPQIEAASQALEAHRADFLKLTKDEKAYLNRIHTLFAEEPFAPLRFTADDVRRAFDQVGTPSNIGSEDRFVKTLRAAVLHLADEDRRSRLAMRLMMLLPEYVAAGRPLEAWIIQHCAILTRESPDESNPFLFEMFSYGYDAWVAEQHRRDAVLLRQMGLSLEHLQSMSLDEIDAWIQEQQADPAMHARMEALLLANPEQRAQANASLAEMERDSIKLLEREDARALLLPLEEIKPWLPILNERLESRRDQWPDPAAPPNPDSLKALADVIWPVISQMAGKIFTPERIRQLNPQLKTYRNDRFAAGEKRVAGSALAVIQSLEREDDPAQNYFLNALCFASLRRVMNPTPDEELQDDAGPAPEPSAD